MKFSNNKKNEINVIEYSSLDGCICFNEIKLINYKKSVNKHLYGFLYIFRKINKIKNVTPIIAIFTIDMNPEKISVGYLGFSVHVNLLNINRKLMEPISCTKYNYFESKIMVGF